MKRLVGAVMAVALLVSVAPVLAGDAFHALGRLPAALTPLDDAQLASVEGGDMTVLQSTSMHVSQNTTVHTSQAEWRWAVTQGDEGAAQALVTWLWTAAQGNVVVAQQLATWLHH